MKRDPVVAIPLAVHRPEAADGGEHGGPLFGGRDFAIAVHPRLDFGAIPGEFGGCQQGGRGHGAPPDFWEATKSRMAHTLHTPGSRISPRRNFWTHSCFNPLPSAMARADNGNNLSCRLNSSSSFGFMPP